MCNFSMSLLHELQIFSVGVVFHVILLIQYVKKNVLFFIFLCLKSFLIEIKVIKKDIEFQRKENFFFFLVENYITHSSTDLSLIADYVI